MKIGKSISVILLLLAATTGCTKEDRSDCTLEDNVTLMFVMKELDGIDRFEENVRTVELMLFDEEGLMISHDHVNEAKLRQFPGVKKSIKPGKYYAVCWGNAAENSRFPQLTPGITNWNDCFIDIPSTATQTGDPIYYAPYKKNPYSRAFSVPQSRYDGDYSLWEVNVPFAGTVIKEMNFIRAHRTVNVYIKGLVDKVGNIEYLPNIEAQHVWGRYNFFYETQNYRVNFLQQSKLTKIQQIGTYLQEELPAATFHGGFGEILTDINLVVRRGSDGTVIHTVNLRQFLYDNPDEDKNDVNILISFLDDHGVTVTVPNWSTGQVTPGTK